MFVLLVPVSPNGVRFGGPTIPDLRFSTYVCASVPRSSPICLRFVESVVFLPCHRTPPPPPLVQSTTPSPCLSPRRFSLSALRVHPFRVSPTDFLDLRPIDVSVAAHFMPLRSMLRLYPAFPDLNLSTPLPCSLVRVRLYDSFPRRFLSSPVKSVTPAALPFHLRLPPPLLLSVEETALLATFSPLFVRSTPLRVTNVWFRTPVSPSSISLTRTVSPFSFVVLFFFGAHLLGDHVLSPARRLVFDVNLPSYDEYSSTGYGR